MSGARSEPEYGPCVVCAQKTGPSHTTSTECPIGGLGLSALGAVRMFRANQEMRLVLARVSPERGAQ